MSDLLQQIVDNEFEIQPDKQFFRDGGIIGFTIKDANKQTQHLFLDGRINSSTNGVFYRGYPGAEGAVDLGKNDELANILKFF